MFSRDAQGHVYLQSAEVAKPIATAAGPVRTIKKEHLQVKAINRAMGKVAKECHRLRDVLPENTVEVLICWSRGGAEAHTKLHSMTSSGIRVRMLQRKARLLKADSVRRDCFVGTGLPVLLLCWHDSRRRLHA